MSEFEQAMADIGKAAEKLRKRFKNESLLVSECVELAKQVWVQTRVFPATKQCRTAYEAAGRTAVLEKTLQAAMDEDMSLKLAAVKFEGGILTVKGPGYQAVLDFADSLRGNLEATIEHD